MSSVSVVIPNRDGGELLARCLDALAAADGVGDVIVVDDGSSDGSPELARARGAAVMASSGRGFAAAVNHGVAHTRSELVLILNSDAFVEPDAPVRLARALDSDPRLALCAAGLVDERGRRTRSHGHELTLIRAIGLALHVSTPPPPEAPPLQVVGFVPLACAVVRTAAWREVGGLDERFRFYFEDHDLCWRLRRAGSTVAVCWAAHAIHEGGGSSRARDAAAWMRQFHESRLRYLRKRYSGLWPAYVTVSTPAALAHAGLWWLRAARGRPEGRAWAAAYARAAVAGLR